MDTAKDFLKQILIGKNIKFLLDDTGTKLKVQGDIHLLSDDDKVNIGKYKEEIIKLLQQRDITKKELDNQIPKVSLASRYQVSDAQRRLWVLSQFEAGSLAYHMPVYEQLSIDTDVSAFERSLYAVIERHEVLRTVFESDEQGDVYQRVLSMEEQTFELFHQDFSQSTDLWSTLEAFIAEDNEQSFDLSQGPLLRASLIRTSEGYLFYYNMHHIISDGWSMEVLLRDVKTYYQSYSTGTTEELPPLRIQYRDYSHWQLSQQETSGSKTYWQQQLSGEIPQLNYPSFKPRPRVQTYNGSGYATYLSKELTDGLRSYSQSNGGSLFMGLLSAWQILSYRYTGELDQIIGSPVAGREHPELNDQIGFYINTLPLRNKIETGDSFNSFFERVKENTLSAYSHQGYSFDRIVGDLELPRDTSRNVLFDVLLTLQNTSERGEREDYSEEILHQPISVAKYDLDITFVEDGEVLYFGIDYNSDVYEGWMIEQLMSHYRLLLEAMLASPEQDLSSYTYLNDQEKITLLETYNDTQVDYPSHQTVVDLFQNQSQQTPSAIALICEEVELSYEKLDTLSNQLAHSLTAKGIGKEDLVGISLDRSEWVVVSILGVLKSGGAYVPIDPVYPQERIDYILSDSNCKQLIDAGFIAEFQQEQSQYSSEPLEESIQSDQLAYVTYTSGSTGRPKGVQVENKAIIRLVKNTNFVNLSNVNRILGLSSFSFDGSTFDLYMPLLNGRTLVLGASDIIHDLDQFNQTLREQKIDGFFTTTALFNLLVENKLPELGRLKFLLFGGEKVTGRHVSTFKANYPDVDLVHVYGPTENTTYSTWYSLPDKIDEHCIPIGRGIANSTCYVLDDQERLVPHGVTGELHVGGDGLARGYQNLEESTAEKFISVQCSGGHKLYKTGDLVRWTKDGQIEFVGRIDHQVKIRGHRIEPAEIKAAIDSFDLISDSFVTIHQPDSYTKEITGYYIPNEEVTAGQLKSYLSDKLPAYMIPLHLISVDTIPLTINGKIKVDELPVPDFSKDEKMEYVSLETEKEKQLAIVWESVLGRTSIGANDNFYNLGGDSIKAIQVVARLKQVGLHISVSDILGNPVFSKLAFLASGESNVIIDQNEVVGQVNLTPIQQYFFKDLSIDNLHHFNQSMVLWFKGGLDSEILQRSLSKLTEHHDALRMKFQLENDGSVKQFVQGIKESAPVKLAFYDLSSSEEPSSEMEKIGKEIQTSINLEEGGLFRAVQFRLKDGDRIALICHHLIVDGVSWRILMEDLKTCYESYLKGEEAELPLKSHSYKSWSEALGQFITSDKFAIEQQYWQNITTSEIPDLIENQSDEVYHLNGQQSFTLEIDETQLLLNHVPEVYTTEVNDLLLTGLLLASQQTWGVEKLAIKMEGHGREDIVEGIDLSRTVGWFTSIYPLVLEVDQSTKQLPALVSVKEQLRQVPNKGIGYGILKYLSEGSLSNVSPSMVFNYLGDFGGKSEEENEVLFQITDENIGQNESSGFKSKEPINISGYVINGQLTLNVQFADTVLSEREINQFATAYHTALLEVGEQLKGVGQTIVTPSDLTYKGLSIPQLEELNSEHNVEDVYPLSPLQEGLFFHWLTDSESEAYFEQMSYGIKVDQLGEENVFRAFKELIHRHGILRTRFSNDIADIPLQIVHQKVDVQFKFISLLELDSRTKKAEIDRIKLEDRREGFDLSIPSQMRLKVVELEKDRYEFIWSHHHILTDGWCMSILLNEFEETLKSIQKNIPPVLSTPKPYSDYISWLESVDKEKSKTYWSNYLESYSQFVGVPFKKEESVDEYKLTIEGIDIIGEEYQAVSEVCRDLDITLNNYCQVVWGVLLSKLNNSRDIVFGAVVSGRPASLTGVENMIGLFINTIPVRIIYDENTSVKELLSTVQKNAIEASDHHYLSLSELQSCSELVGGLIDHVFVFENYPLEEAITGENDGEENSLLIDSFDVHEQTNYDFNICLAPSKEGVRIEFQYNAAKYEENFIQRMIGQYLYLINDFVKNIDQYVRDAHYLSQQNCQTWEWSHGALSPISNNTTILDLFHDQVKSNFNQVAITSDTDSYTFGELDEISSHFAAFLQRQKSLKNDGLVGVKLERNSWLIISILAVWKCGGAYVPIDLNYPQERIVFIEKDAGVKFCIEDELIEQFHSLPKACLLPASVTSSNLAYVIYTSGTTGKPKGVKVAHSAVVNITEGWRDVYQLNLSKESLLQLASFSFDVFVGDFCRSILSGGKMVMCSDEGKLDVNYLGNLIDQHQVTMLEGTPQFVLPLAEYLFNNEIGQSLKRMILGSDKLSVSDYNYLVENYGSKLDLFNTYGVTEATIDSTYCKLNEISSDSFSYVPIGKPFPNIQVYLLDRDLNLVDSGTQGELYIGGLGLSKGYIGVETLNFEKFVQIDHKEFRKPLYKTGDLGQWTKNGDIEFFGRNDNQVKVRGYRIELGEIENALEQLPEVKEGVVVTHCVTTNAELIAYVVLKKNIRVDEIISKLNDSLPTYMIPSTVVILDFLPLTKNGKVNRKTLEKQVVDRMAVSEYLEPENPLEIQLCSIWSQLFDRQIGLNDDFFELGGHSILLLKLINKYQQELKSSLSIKDLYEKSKVRDHLALIQDAIAGVVSIPLVEEMEYYPLSFAQKRTWVLSQFEVANSIFNMPGYTWFDGNVSEDILKDAVRLTMIRHESLRTIFSLNEEEEVTQKILPVDGFEVPIDFEIMQDQSLVQDRIERFMVEQVSHSFNLETGPLFFLNVIRVNEEKTLVLYNMHHIIGDAWSDNIFLRDIQAYYFSLSNQVEPQLPELRIQYRDFASWEVLQLQNGQFNQSQKYWKNKFSDEIPVLELPSQFDRPKVKTYTGNRIETYLNPSMIQELNQTCGKHNTTMFTGLVALWNTLLYRYTGQKDLVIGTPVAGRQHSELEDQIGYYLNTIALRNQVDSKKSFNDLLMNIKDSIQQDLAHQNYPFDLLVDELNLKRDPSRSALFDVMINLVNTTETDESDVEFEYEVFNEVANTNPKFDLNISFEPVGKSLYFCIDYNSEIHSGQWVEQLMKHFVNLTKEVVSAPEKQVSAINYLFQEEVQKQLVNWSGEKLEIPLESSIIDSFKHRAKQYSNRVALVHQQKTYTYQQLDEVSDKLAGYILAYHKIAPDDFIGIMLDRSDWLVISILAVLKVNGCYVPIDLSYPEERKQYILDDSAVTLCIDQTLIDHFLAADPQEVSIDKLPERNGELVYVIYTSGSTGNPKGVLVRKSGVLNLVGCQTKAFGINSDDHILLFSSVSFDASVEQLYLALLNGASIHVPELTDLLDDEQFDNYLIQHKITHLHAVPGYLTTRNFNENQYLKRIVSGGDTFDNKLLDSVHSGIQVINEYGPTETTVTSIQRVVSEISNPNIIGRPLGNTYCYVLGEGNSLNAEGVAGELYIGGDGVAKGYLNSPDLTQERFIENPFRENEVMYKTGDLVRWTSTGELEFLGRLDDQVKIRGHRIELGEISLALQKHPQVSDAIVIAKKMPSAEKELTAYLVNDKDIELTTVRQVLGETLPDYMIPSYLVQLRELPLLPNGKVNKNALPNPLSEEFFTESEVIAPGNEIETELMKIWESVLGRSGFGIQHNFFELGGHSIKSVRIITEVKKQFDVKLDIGKLFYQPTIEELAKEIENYRWQNSEIDEEDIVDSLTI